MKRKKQKLPPDRILTKHPLGKSGKSINKETYDTVKQAIVSALQAKELTHTELFEQLNETLKGKISGNVSWYVQTVKLDLEASKILQRTPSKRYRLKDGPGPKKQVYRLFQ